MRAVQCEGHLQRVTRDDDMSRKRCEWGWECLCVGGVVHGGVNGGVDGGVNGGVNLQRVERGDENVQAQVELEAIEEEGARNVLLQHDGFAV